MDVIVHALTEVDAVGALSYDYIKEHGPSQSVKGQSPLSTKLLYRQQTSSSAFVMPETPNGILLASLPACPVSCLTSRFIGGIASIRSSNLEGATDLHFSGDQQLSAGVSAPSPPPPLPGPPSPSQSPSALEEANVDGPPCLPPPSSHSAISAPTPNTPMNPRDNLDTFIHALSQELRHSPKYAQMHVQP